LFVPAFPIIGTIKRFLIEFIGTNKRFLIESSNDGICRRHFQAVNAHTLFVAFSSSNSIEMAFNEKGITNKI